MTCLGYVNLGKYPNYVISVYFSRLLKLKKINNILLSDCRGLVHLFSYRCLQMWSTNCRRFTS
ncbi:hypothetical protein Hanom_Chr12g01065321 [Helianthus anomalus]